MRRCPRPPGFSPPLTDLTRVLSTGYLNNLLPTSSGSINNNGLYGFYDGVDGYTTINSGNVNNLMYYNNLTTMPDRGPAAYTVAGGPWFPNNNNNGGCAFVWPHSPGLAATY